MKRFVKPIQAVLLFAIIAALTGCNLGSAAEPTPTAVDVNAVMTSAAATAFAQLTEIAALATPTTAPTATQAVVSTPEAGFSATPDAAQPQATTQPPIVEATNTPETVAGASVTPAIAAPTVAPLPTNTTVAAAANPGPVCWNAVYLEDVTVMDGTEFNAWDKFYKVWRMQNNGTCTWDEGFTFKAWAGPPSMTDGKYVLTGGQKVGPGESIDIGIKMYAPGDAGEYVAHWSWYDDQGKAFGQSVSVVIKVK